MDPDAFLLSGELLSAQIECRDWREILKRYDKPGSYFYIDPPHFSAERRNGDRREMSAADYQDLVTACAGLKGMAMLSGDRNGCYDLLQSEHGWSRADFKTFGYAPASGNGASLRKVPRTESIWINPQLQRALKEEGKAAV